jgi:GR25 family glycosyltransferase involved in LPS biosynthesis
MKHYWINIDKCIDRRQYMEQQFNSKMIDNFRIEAETPNTIKEYQIMRNEKSTAATPEELSCIISHLKAIKKGYEDGDPYFCIVEDDMVLNKIKFDKILAHIKIAEEFSDEPIDILQLHTNGHPSVIKMYNENFLKYNEIIKKRDYDYPSAGYYLISRQGAEKLLKKYVISEKEYDLSHKECEWSAADNIIYIAVNSWILTYPITISNVNYGSTIHPEHLYNHEYCNNVNRDIWNKNNQLKMFL